MLSDDQLSWLRRCSPTHQIYLNAWPENLPLTNALSIMAHIDAQAQRIAELEHKIDSLVANQSPRAAPGKRADRCAICGATLSHRQTLRLDQDSGEWRCERH